MKKTFAYIALSLLLVAGVFALAAKNEPSKKLDETICTFEYAPVCGVNGITYGNSCMAQETEIAYEGECSDNQAAGGTFPAGSEILDMTNEELATS